MKMKGQPAVRISAWRPPAATGTPWTASHAETWIYLGLLPLFPSVRVKRILKTYIS